MNKLCACGMAMTFAILSAGSLLVVGLVNRYCPDYGQAYLNMMSSVYPGYHAADGLKNLGIGVIYALVDGGICGALLAWIYNAVTSRCCCSKKTDDQKCC